MERMERNNQMTTIEQARAIEQRLRDNPPNVRKDRHAANIINALITEIERLREVAQQALAALEVECGGRCNAENNPCHAVLAADECRKLLK